MSEHPGRLPLSRGIDVMSADEDWVGNNAAFKCDACQRVYVVSGFLHPKGRPCPFCAGTIGFVEGGRDSFGRAWIELKNSN